MPEKLTQEAIHQEVSGIVVDPKSGDEYEATFKDLKDSEREKLAELEEQLNDGDEEAGQELQDKVIGEYLIEPDLDPDDLGLAWKQSVIVGFLRALGDNKAVQSANELFDTVDQGNR